MFIRSFHSAVFLVLMVFYCVSANGSWEDRVYIHCPVQLRIPDVQDQVPSYLGATLFSGKLNWLLLEHRKIGFKYHIPKPGVYESAGGVLEFFPSGEVHSLKCEYFGLGGVEGEVFITINSGVPFSLMNKAALNPGEPDCMPFSPDSYGGAEYVPCVLEPEFSLIVSHGPAMEIVEQTEGGVKMSSKEYVVVAAKDSASYYLSASDQGEKKDISSLCSGSEVRNHPLYISSNQRHLYEFILEPYGQSSFLTCYKGGRKQRSMSWHKSGYDYARSRHSYQQEYKSWKSRAGDGWKQSGHQSGSNNGWRQSGGNQNGRYRSYNDPAMSWKEWLASNIVYLSSFFGSADFIYQFVGGGPVEKTYVDLGLPLYTVNITTIKKHCRAVKMKHHPDKGGDAETFNFYSAKCEELIKPRK